MKPAAQFKQVSVQIKKDTILSDINLTIIPGQVTGLLGPSGAGKTTLMRVMMGLQRVSSGTATILGKSVGDPEIRTHVGYVTQVISVYLDLTVLENLRYFAVMVGASLGRIKAVLELVDLAPYANHMVHDLSGGQQSRVSLAVALLGDPEFLVLDEPTVGLDPVLREQLWNTFRTMASHGTTLVVSSHVMDEAERCDSLLLLREGKLLASGTPAELKHQTKTSTVEGAFLHLVKHGK